METRVKTDGTAARGTKNRTVEFLGDIPRQLLIAGKWVAAQSGRTFSTVNPATEEILATVAEGDAADVDAAVNAAREAFENGPWPRITPHQRTKYLLKIAELVQKHADELAHVITLDNGKPIAEARSEVARTAEVFIYYAGWATKIFGETNPSELSLFNYTLREPLGVCGQIIPWNGPLSMVAWKVAPALACGNTVVLKPAEQTPLPALAFGQLTLEAGLPAGVVNIVTGFGPTAGAAIARHPAIDKVAFTGSTSVGKEILQAAAGNLKHVSLELGGKSPNIIFDDANIELAVAGSATGIFRNQGQVCCAGSRIFVQQKTYDEFTERLAQVASDIRLADPLQAGTTMGPLVSDEQYERVLGYLKVGKQEGARVRAGGERGPQARGYFVRPTVFADVKSSMRIAREEIFGPVASLIPFRDESDAVLQANDTTYGLAAAVWTRDVRRALALARRLRAGTIWINCYGILDPISPFGGYKQSGFGRELGKDSIELYTQAKSVFVKLGNSPAIASN
jgi:acyl-CoA reductase-like NAD-dependent aldehyde dehydrogenase